MQNRVGSDIHQKRTKAFRRIIAITDKAKQNKDTATPYLRRGSASERESIPQRPELQLDPGWQPSALSSLYASAHIMKMRLFGQWLTYLFVRATITTVNLLPLFVCSMAARVLSCICFDLLRVRRQVTDENLSHAFPHWTSTQRRRVGRRMWQHFMLMACEAVQCQRRITVDNWEQFVNHDPENTGPMDEYLRSDRGCLLMSCHYGNFEAQSTFAQFGYPRYTIARPLDNPFLDRYIRKLRERAGQKMLPKKDIAETVARYLEEGHNVAILGDQQGGPKGCWVNFFGRPASYHKSIALFALTARVPIVVAYFRRSQKPCHFELRVSGILDPNDPQWENADLRDVTKWFNALFEEMIRESPEQYWWLHRRWKGTPSSRVQKELEGERSVGAQANSTTVETKCDLPNAA